VLNNMLSMTATFYQSMYSTVDGCVFCSSASALDASVQSSGNSEHIVTDSSPNFSSLACRRLLLCGAMPPRCEGLPGGRLWSSASSRSSSPAKPYRPQQPLLLTAPAATVCSSTGTWGYQQAKAGTNACCCPGHTKMTKVSHVLADLTEHCHWRHQYRHSKHRLSVTNYNKAIGKQQNARPVLPLSAKSMMMGTDKCLSCRLTDFCRCFRRRVMSLMFAFFC